MSTSDETTASETWDQMSDEAKIDWLAVNIMQWKPCESEGIAYWDNGQNTLYLRKTEHQNRGFVEGFDPLSYNWNDFRMLEERLMEDGKGSAKRYLQRFDGKGHLLGADLPERCLAVFLSLQ